jgi:hypothetical protein
VDHQLKRWLMGIPSSVRGIFMLSAGKLTARSGALRVMIFFSPGFIILFFPLLVSNVVLPFFEANDERHC